ncbi:MAG: hypothetical protein AB1400_08955 [Pseudomonadota bacterium]
MSTTLFFVLISLLSAISCHRIAKARGVNPVQWGVNGFVFGPLALPFVLRCKPQKA